MFVTPSKRKAGQGDEPEGKRVKEESNTKNTSYAKKSYYQESSADEETQDLGWRRRDGHHWLKLRASGRGSQDSW
ncbi:hypothetical protein BN14_12346 [Rhizoctonia solani AG-1 IB]|uniref:Uncharacterized protein n=1 Tax=Thanatephorus cucumeris (strain AG1-IB / isolate 7/3/14) TaxID=1108050 RepID=M5CFD8_THACB|nr:hypothetical protein BN14_12346 [Rhizoctonia solani AG-1 IB]